MFHVTLQYQSNDSMTGLYSLRKIASVSGGRFLTLDRPVDEFDLNYATTSQEYCVQAIAIPDMNNFTVDSNTTLIPKKYSTTIGGIVAFKTRGDVNFGGLIKTEMYGPLRQDKHQLTHAGLIDRFIINRGGGIFIICGGKFKLTGKIGTGASAGYGGLGLSGESYSTGKSGVGGVGGGVRYKTDGQFYSGSDAGTGGTGGSMNNYKYAGVQGTMTGGNGQNGAGLTPENFDIKYQSHYASSGASMILIAKSLELDENSLLLGGCQSVPGNNVFGYQTISGSGGTGFAYIACGGINS